MAERRDLKSRGKSDIIPLLPWSPSGAVSFSKNPEDQKAPLCQIAIDAMEPVSYCIYPQKSTSECPIPGEYGYSSE